MSDGHTKYVNKEKRRRKKEREKELASKYKSLKTIQVELEGDEE